MQSVNRVKSAVEFGVGARHFDEQLRRLETVAESRGVSCQPLHDRTRSATVYVAEWPAKESRESEAEYRPDVSVTGLADDPLGEGAGRFVQQGQDEALFDFLPFRPGARKRRSDRTRRCRRYASFPFCTGRIRGLTYGPADLA